MCKIKSTEDLTNFFCKLCSHIKEHDQTVDLALAVQQQLSELDTKIEKLENRFQKAGLFFNENKIIKDEYGRYQQVRGQDE